MDQTTFEAGAASAEPVAHPYYPLGVAMPKYTANTISTPALLAYFTFGTSLILSATYFITQFARPKLPTGRIALTMWFVLCGFIHLFFEGYFSVNSLDMVSRGDIFGQLWKEYSLSDSRYLTQDAFVVCMESITAFLWGPLSFYIAYCIVADHPAQHPLRIIVGVGQIYGDVLYLSTCSYNEIMYDLVYCRPEMIYYWAYYILCNAFWIVIPAYIVYLSVVEIMAVFSRIKAMESAAGKKDL